VERTQLELFPGLLAERVTSVRAENLLRGWTLRADRIEGRWELRDPQIVPAQEALIGHLIQNALAARASEVARTEAPALAEQFDPPKLILELEADGRRERIEFGLEDPTRNAAYVRVRNTIARVGLDLYTALNRPVEDFKTTVVLDFAPALVRGIERRGQGWKEGSQQRPDATLKLAQTDGEWQLSAPVPASPDLAALSVWLQGVAGIRHEGYADELGRKPSDYGLDPALLTLRLDLLDGSHRTLRVGAVGPAGGESWFVMREDLGIVWAIEPRDAYLLSLPIDTFLDTRILRARRDEVDGLRLHSGPSEVRITREGRLWKVAERRSGEKGFDAAYLADDARIEDLLSELARLELEGFRLNEPLAEGEDMPALEIRAGGQLDGGTFGSTLTSPQGSASVLFQRRGEAVTGFAPLRLLELVKLPADQFWSKRLLEIPEHAQVSLQLRLSGERVLSYQRSARGQWTREGTEAQARELLPLLDGLCFVRAERHLPPRTDPDWKETIEVRFQEPGGKRNEYRLGRTSEGAIEVIVGARRALLADPTLFDRLLAL
jgi:hypothetical protein